MDEPRHAQQQRPLFALNAKEPKRAVALMDGGDTGLSELRRASIGHTKRKRQKERKGKIDESNNDKSTKEGPKHASYDLA